MPFAFSEPSPEVYPVKPRDWVARIGDPGRVATVKDVSIDRGEILVDLYLYDRDGHRIGRESPALGGPRSFEPCCTYTGHWQRIERPDFPIRVRWIPTGEGRKTAMLHHGRDVLPDRQWVRRQLPLNGATIVKSDFDPELEIRSRLMAAQELRDMARMTGVAELVARAEALEKEAEAFRTGAGR